MTIVYVVRHGETEWNRDGIHQGHMDSALTETGERQARLMGDRLAGENAAFDAIYSSDLGRCLQTARTMCDPLGAADRIVKDPQLRERALGVIEGLTYAELAGQLPDDHRQHISGDPDYRPEGGESWRDLFERSKATLAGLAARHGGGRILCVTHGGVVSMAMRACLEIDLEKPRNFRIPNTALNVFEIDAGRWTLQTWGDVSHLGGEAGRDEML